MFDKLYSQVQSSVKHSAWVISDLQQPDPAKARHCLETAASDFEQLGKPADQIWYLGDAVHGNHLEHLCSIAGMQEERLAKLNLPLFFLLGNHDLDYANNNLQLAPVIPFYEKVQNREGWVTTASMEQFFFKARLGEYTVYFLSDHIDPGNRWVMTHGRVFRGEEYYPYSQKHWDQLRTDISTENGPVITVGHYSFPGGNRESAMLKKLTPLPGNVRLHCYGHAHIGDWTWAGKDAYRRISWIDWHDIPQVNVSSLDNIRGESCRSVLLHIYENGQLGLFFRDHERRAFTEAYFPAALNYPSKASCQQE